MVICNPFFIANEYRNWLLYYSAPLMADLLPPPYYQHLLMLIKGIQIILQQEIPVAELEIAERHLNTFSHLMADLYGIYY